jgi:hypothetical protein
LALIGIDSPERGVGYLFGKAAFHIIMRESSPEEIHIILQGVLRWRPRCHDKQVERKGNVERLMSMLFQEKGEKERETSKRNMNLTVTAITTKKDCFFVGGSRPWRSGMCDGASSS